MNLRLLGTGVAIAIASMLSNGAAAETAAASTMSPVQQLVDGINIALDNGDGAAIALAYAPGNVSIIDSPAPQHWSGPDAAKTWLADMLADYKKSGATEGGMGIGDPVMENVTCDTAYVVVPATFRFRAQGKAMRENGLLACSLARTAGKWGITGWSFATTKPELDPDAAPAPAAAAH